MSSKEVSSGSPSAGLTLWITDGPRRQVGFSLPVFSYGKLGKLVYDANELGMHTSRTELLGALIFYAEPPLRLVEELPEERAQVGFSLPEAIRNRLIYLRDGLNEANGSGRKIAHIGSVVNSLIEYAELPMDSPSTIFEWLKTYRLATPDSIPYE